jgi:hypothetical protein
VVWAIDLDTTGLSSFNLQGGSTENVVGAQFFQKKQTMNMQKQIQTTVFWSRCLNDNAADRHCPPGYHELATGHGRVYDAEAFDVSSGCHGNQNRVLCMHNLIIEDTCVWNRDGKGVWQTSISLHSVCL